MRRLAPLAVVAVLLAGGCGPADPATPSGAPSPPAASAAPPAPASPSPAPVLTAAKLLDTVLIGDDLLASMLSGGTAEVDRTYDGDHSPGYPAGVVTACGKRSASSTGDAKQVKGHARAWTANGWVVVQEAFVLPRQHGKDVVAKVASLLKGCKSYSDGDTYRKTARNTVAVQSGLYRGAAACFAVAGVVECHAYLGRGRVVTMLSALGADQEMAEFLLTQVKTAAEAQLAKVPA
ncbi:hypothetical protein [Catellatospora vulcania]|uniref:hypothetical protein n=1 Tax=Catellatospora vulcania TaxID=1460450 RepID=UPI0012D3C631|nr:hypothetical protein [Catellatospora vulcania]